MKNTNKLWSLIALLVAVCVLASVVMTGCGITDIIKVIESGENSEDDPQESSNESSGDDNTAEMKSDEEIKNLLGDEYLITIKVLAEAEGEESTSYQLTVASNGEYQLWIGEEGESALQKKVEGGTLYYSSSDAESEGYDSMAFIDASQSIDPFMYVSYLFFTNVSDLAYTSKSSETFLGRSCTKYINETSGTALVASVSVTETWVVDNATGACLKHEWSATGMAEGEYASGSASFECTKFEVGKGTGDALINEYVGKIEVPSVPDQTILSKAGLNEDVRFEVISPDYLTSAQLNLEGSVSFTYTIRVEEISADFVISTSNSLAEALFEGGAKFNMDGEPYDSYQNEDIYTSVSQETFSSVQFTAYTSNGSQVQINAINSDYTGFMIQILIDYGSAE